MSRGQSEIAEETFSAAEGERLCLELKEQIAQARRVMDRAQWVFGIDRTDEDPDPKAG